MIILKLAISELMVVVRYDHIPIYNSPVYVFVNHFLYQYHQQNLWYSFT